MKITLQNGELNAAINFLSSMELRGMEKSRQRSKLRDSLLLAAKEYQESQREIFEKHGRKDSSGELVINKEKNGYEIKKESQQEYREDMITLLLEEVVIDGGIHANLISGFGETLAGYDGILSGENADIYDRLMDEFEKEENQDVKD
ncbi:DUF1617 family protein [Enterococcus casseliflavus]|uniref:DUF1617 family protein n=1 Tax=Enterococcus casseliflavus TaxID=37734 RepID=UPI001C8B2C9E|nr:DUF1617 family protein [Enterococcus casseliflavus]MBX9115911.1 DUF1617 family protein [Enterococcus casseliflavus]MBX9126360.1 DUF1617 family protein [Enterococcus casseliflavus]